MYTWVFITIFAAAMQTIRTSLQKSLKKHLPSDAITWIRYSFGLPLALCYVSLLHVTGLEIPDITLLFLLYCFIAGITQIIATILLVSLFSYRNFAVGTAYAKTEAIQTALIAVILFGETINLGSVIAIIVGLIGIMLISMIEDKLHWKSIITGLTHKPALIGICCGGIFAISIVFIRQASLLLESESNIMNAALTLVTMISMQIPLLGLWLIYKNPKIFLDIVSHWKSCTLVGITGVLGSIGYFTALSMAKAAYVITVGQIEIIFSVLVTHNIFKEHINRLEILGIILVTGSILLLLYSASF